MNKLYQLLAKSPNYIRRFGVISGVRLLCQIEGLRQLPQKSERVKPYVLPGFNAPIHLRDCLGDHAIFWQCLVMNQYDFSHFPQAERLNRKYDEIVKSGRTPLIIDCGGNIGLSVIWFANKFPKAKIFVVEPDQANLEILKLNVASFEERVVILKGGIWNEAGYLQIINPEAGPSAYRVQPSHPADTPNTIRCHTINEICHMANINDPLIVKVDIEGSQKYLFSGNTDWVNRTDLITLELDDWLLPWQGTSRSFFKCLSQFDFDYLLNGESIFCFRDQVTPLETS
ncbi:MAG: FkbM family methyltransferase [Burkholderiaceae bacterium]|nr:FkbM family methyltransferase [Burkholderiaceae bacterium]